MEGTNKDVGLYERVAALEKLVEIVIPEIDRKLAKIDGDINDGLRSEVLACKSRIDTHLEITGLKELASKEMAEKKAKRNLFWMVFIRSVMVGTFIAAVGILLESLLR